MSSSDEPSSSRSLIMLFILGWGLVLVAAFARSVYLCIMKVFGGNDRLSNDGTRNMRTSGGRILVLELYRTMSSERKEEIENLRKNALLRYLSGFTLELGDEHLLCCSGSQTDTTLSASSEEEVDEESLTLDERGKDLEDIDIEEGNNIVIEKRDDLAQSQDNDSTAAADCTIEHTHISIPFPGFDIAGINICSIAETEKQERQTGKRLKLPSLYQTGDDIVAVESQPEQTESVTVNSIQKQLLMTEKRRVPIFCAICLSEYEKWDRVCWSSNKECTHVFHESCILQWLMTSGKKKSMNKYFTRHPSDEELLENAFCPCCRQDFICVNASLHGSEESV